MNPINVHPDSTVTTLVHLYFGDTRLASGSGFFFVDNGVNYLITNWHNVTGRDPQSLKPISPTAALPDRIAFFVCKKGVLGHWDEAKMPLYKTLGAAPRAPVWKEHKVHRHKIDVVAIPFSLPANSEIHPINAPDRILDIKLGVSSDVFVLGYPKGISGEGVFPIWKRASVATEPDIDLDGLPKMLIDTATREGMSGAPVVAMTSGTYRDSKGNMNIGLGASKIVGVYSGRLGDDEMQAQLGIVWKASVIEEIVREGIPGTNSFTL
jgi:hypothetical protein